MPTIPPGVLLTRILARILALCLEQAHMDRLANQTIKPLELLQASPLSSVAFVLGVGLASYAIYYRYLVSVARYPGPALATVTDLWQALNSESFLMG